MNTEDTNFPMQKLTRKDFPRLLEHIPSPPSHLYIRGTLPDPSYKVLCVVGTRKMSDYGRAVCKHLLSGLRGYPVIIVSGLALGIDALAHKTALDLRLPTIAFPGSGLADEAIYPQSHLGLAHAILENGGTLLSEFEPQFRAAPWIFVQRNRLMAGIADATLVIEADLRSGTLITAGHALEYNRELLTVPGSIFSQYSRGPHSLIRQGAQIVESGADILEALGLHHLTSPDGSNLSPAEKVLLEHLAVPMSYDILLRLSGLTPADLHTAISLLEIKGFLSTLGGTVSRLDY